MKKLSIILTIVVATAMIFSSCGKYEEGPAVSLLTKKARITGSWTISETTIGGVVQDDQGWVSTITMEKDGTGTYAFTGEYGGMTISTTSNLEWEFDDTKESLRIRVADEDGVFYDNDWEESEIIKLTNSECWLQDTETYSGADVITINKLTKN